MEIRLEVSPEKAPARQTISRHKKLLSVSIRTRGDLKNEIYSQLRHRRANGSIIKFPAPKMRNPFASLRLMDVEQ